jgi:cytidylate kinase
MIIAIDGPSGTGKSTVARGIAGRLGFTFFDTGAMYRSVAWKVLQENKDPSNKQEVCASLADFQYQIQCDEEHGRRYFVGNQDVTHAIRAPNIASVASQIAVYPEVRKALVVIQRKFGHRCNAVFEGRDMGTVVFPDADLKIFLHANAEERAKRRYRELLTKFPDLAASLHLKQIQKEIEERDFADTTRHISPLKAASDAISIDTSGLSVNEVIDKIISLLPSKKKYPRMKFSYWFVYSLARLFFKVCFRLRIFGLEHFRPGPGIIAGNHCSNYDPPVLSISCPEEVHFLAKQSLFRVPFLGKLIRILNSHPITGDGGDTQTFRQVLSLLEERKKVLLFPEGRRSSDGTLQPLQRGLGFIVKKAKCPIFPCYIKGTFDAWPPQGKWPKLFGKISCVFGSPIEWGDFEGLEKKEMEKQIMERATESLQKLQEWLEAGAKGTPP